MIFPVLVSHCLSTCAISEYVICIYYYMACSVSRPVLCPDVPVSAQVRRTRADTGTRGMIQGVIQNKTCNNLFITYIKQKAVSYMQLGTRKDKIR